MHRAIAEVARRSYSLHKIKVYTRNGRSEQNLALAFLCFPKKNFISGELYFKRPKIAAKSALCARFFAG